MKSRREGQTLRDRVAVLRDLIERCGGKPTRKRVHALRVITLRIQAEAEDALSELPQASREAQAVLRFGKRASRLRQALGSVRELDVWMVKLSGLRESFNDTPAYVFGGVFAIEGVMHPQHRIVTAEDLRRAADVAEREDADLQEEQISEADATVLRGWSLRPHRANGDAVILLHGQGDNRAGMLGPAEMLLREGYSVLLPDARAHGESGGTIATYGVLEADDVRRWFDWLMQSQSPHCIEGGGDSMRGAELLRSLDEEHGFCAVVAESPFATFEEAAYDRLGQQFSTGAWLGRTVLRPAVYAGVLYARFRYGTDMEKANPARSVREAGLPVMLIHGLADNNLPPRHSEMIKAASPSVALWEPRDADHCGASTAAPEEYERRVIAGFVSMIIGEEPA